MIRQDIEINMHFLLQIILFPNQWRQDIVKKDFEPKSPRIFLLRISNVT